MSRQRHGVLRWWLVGALVGVPTGAATAGDVTLDDDEWQPQTEAADAPALRSALVAWHRAWAERDLPACGKALDGAVLRAVPGVNGIQSGRDQVLAALPNEWSEFEQDPAGGSALSIALRDVVVQRSGDAALLHYHVDIRGGTRWEFEDTAAQAAIFTKSASDGVWRLVFEGGATNLTRDDDDGEVDAGSDRNFSYDYAMPVRDLARAMRFYRPLLGTPEAVVEGVAAYQLNGSRLFLDSTGVAPGKPPKKDLPNGWPIIMAADPAGARQEAMDAGVRFEGEPKPFGGHRLQFGFEPGGTLVALALAPTVTSRGVRQPVEIDPAIRGQRPAPALAEAERRTRELLLAADPATLNTLLGAQASVVDASLLPTAGWRDGKGAVRSLRASAARRTGRVTLSAAHVVGAGPWWVFTRELKTVGPAPWLRQTLALQPLVLDARDARLALSLTANAGRSRELAVDFDYAGIPATTEGWDASAEALRALTGSDDDYVDEGWLGLWGDRAVLGLFEADPEEDGLPRQQAASTYLSLWVRDIDAALGFATKAGARQPHVPAINDRIGIDRNPGYAQVYLSDSEGNGLVLTEYTGRAR